MYHKSKKAKYNNIAVFGFLLFLAIPLLTGSCTGHSSFAVPDDKPLPDSAKFESIRTNFVFGIPADSFIISRDRVRPNRNLSEIVGEYGISMNEVDQLVRNSKDVFNVRSLRAGHYFTIFSEKDSSARLRYLVYEHEPALFYIFSFSDSLNITPYHQPVRSDIRFCSGIIETSLWEAMVKDSINPELAVRLSEIYAWTVDFFSLQKGDGFKVVYEEQYIDNKSIGIGKIYTAEFIYSGRSLFAVPLIQGGKEGYYDTTGNSLRKAFLKAPLGYARVSSGYSSGRMHPILRIVRPHYGVDYAAPVGTPVYSIGDGKVISAGIEEEAGRTVRIRHNSVYTTAYLHLSQFGSRVKPGAFVSQGEVIGYVGSSGLSTGPHLDFRFFRNGYPVDPLKVEAPPVEPVSDSNLVKFEKVRKISLSLLQTLN